jgi:hypothetical protein
VRTLSAAIVLLAALGTGCVENGEAPLFPSYETDVKPIMGARCIRCHGGGGTLNLDPDIPDGNRYTGAPMNGNFTQLADSPPQAGLMFYATTGKILWKGAIKDMPPPPAPPLTERERTILDRWIENPLP